MRKTAKQKAALEEIARIRRNDFNPPDDLVNEVIRKCGPKRALVIMQFAARVDRSIEEVH